MRPSTLTLSVLLGASLLVNVVLLARRPEPPAPSAPRAKAPAPSPTPDAPNEELARERRKSETLEARVRDLEAEKTVLAQASTSSVPAAAAPGVDRKAALREKLRKLIRMMKDPKTAAAMSPEDQLEFSDVYMEIYRTQVGRSKDPGPYLDAVKALYEIGLDEAKHPLNVAQSADLDRLFEEFGATLKGVAGASAPERLVKELEAEADLMTRLDGVLTSEQRQQMLTTAGLAGGFGNMNVVWAERKNAEQQIVQTWTQAYKLEDAQKGAATAAALSYLGSLDRLNAEYKGRESEIWGSGRESYAYRLKAARAQLDALRALEGALSGPQRDAYLSKPPREIRILDQAGAEVVEDK